MSAATRTALAFTSVTTVGGLLPADMLLRMPMDEFEAWCAKNPGRAKRIMGG